MTDAFDIKRGPLLMSKASVIKYNKGGDICFIRRKTILVLFIFANTWFPQA